MSKTVGYARVSTSEQNFDRQLQALSQYVEPDMIVTDKASGKNLNRPGYQSLKIGIGKLVAGDTLYIKSLDRLSRNKEDLRQHRTKTALRLSATSACIFSVILHKNPSTYVSMPSEFLYNLTKNLTAHLRHYLCAVLP